MKRFTKTMVAVMIIAATGAAIMVGCKKEESAQIKDGVAQTEQSMSSEEQKVLDFLADYDAMKQGAKADGEAVTPEQACFQMETVLNYCHGFTQSYLTNIRRDTIVVSMPKTDVQGNIAYSDMLATYGEIVALVRETYKAIDMEDKVLKFVMMSLNKEAKDGDEELTIVMNTGSRSQLEENHIDDPWYATSYPNNVCWHWGRDLGSCTYPFVLPGDAAQQLTNMFAAYDHDHEGPVISCPDCYTYILNPHDVEVFFVPYIQTDSLFYVEGLTWQEVLDYCICPEKIYESYVYIMKRTHYEGMPINPYGIDWYYRIEVEDCLINVDNTGNNCTIYHLFTKQNCTRLIRHYDGVYPVAIDDEE